MNPKRRVASASHRAKTPLVRFNGQDDGFHFVPFFNTSEGCFTRVVQLRLLTCTRPSIPSSISMNAPNSVRLRTRPRPSLPLDTCRAEYPRVGRKLPHASEIRRSVGFTLRTTQSTSSFTLTSLRRMLHPFRPGHSLTCTRPSMPCSSSMNGRSR